MSSKRRLRYKSCRRKRRYQSEQGARSALRGTVARDRAAGLPAGALQTYECRFCGGWHVGHREDEQSFRRTRADVRGG